MARNLGTALSGLKKAGKGVKAPARKGTATMTVEPLNPKAAPVADLTKPVPHSESLVPPKKAGMPTMSISPSPKAGPGWKAQSAIASPGDIARPTQSDIVKT